MTANTLPPFRDFLIELARRSGDYIRPHFGDPALAVETKTDLTPVTAADRGAEELMRALIAKKFPAHGVIGEELGSDRPDAEWVWVLDPIDGTKAFITGAPLWGTLIALLHEGRPVLGAIHQPILNQLMIGECAPTTTATPTPTTAAITAGDAATTTADGVATSAADNAHATTTLNGRPVRVRDTARVEDATILTSDPLNPGKYQNGAAYDALISRARLVRTWGDCYGYLLLAGGWADVMLDPVMNPWDIQALIPIVRGAGGVITDWRGGDPVKADSIVASSRALHPQVIAALNRLEST